MKNAKMKKVGTYVASKTPWAKTHVFKNAKSMSIIKTLGFFLRREKEILSEKFALFPSSLAPLFTYKTLFDRKYQ